MSMGRLHSDLREIYPENTVHIPQIWHRAGNLLTESDLRPEILGDFSQLDTIQHDKIKTCGCVEKLYHNVLLPNGDVSLCCMDYNLDEILGNLFIICVKNSIFCVLSSSPWRANKGELFEEKYSIGYGFVISRPILAFQTP